MIEYERLWKTQKPLLSDKVKSSEKFTWVHEDKIITNDGENAKISKSYFSRVAKHLKIPEIKNTDFIFHLALKILIKQFVIIYVRLLLEMNLINKASVS